MSDDARYRFRFSYEFLDLFRFRDEQKYLAQVAAFFEEKYKEFKPDVVVTGMTLSQFMLDNGRRMFHGAPIIFSWDEDFKPVDAFPEGFYAVSGSVDYAKNLDLIFQTRPSTKKVYVVLGDTDEERAVKDRVVKAAQKWKKRAEFIYLNDLPYAEMLQRIRDADGDSAILFLRWLRDVSGDSFVPIQVLDALSRNAISPIYIVSEQLMGHGVVGGYLFNIEILGRLIADKAYALISKESNATQKNSLETSAYEFDWRQLKRWKIDFGTLPRNAAIEYREYSVWVAYWEYLLAGIAVVSAQTLLIIGLVVNLARRRRAEAEFRRLNESLDEMVSIRTRELNEANIELERAKTLLEDVNSQLDLASRTDNLTGLHNRRHMEEVFHSEHAKCLRTGTPYSVIMCDVDYFKSINDDFGHDAGDAVLKKLADTLAELVRPYDALARWGGEEFLLFLPSTCADGAAALAERLRNLVGERVCAYQGREIRVTITCGTTTWNPGDAVDDVLRRADQALYEGKRSGRNRVVAV